MKRRLLNPGSLAMAHDVGIAAVSFIIALYLRLGSEWYIHAEAYLPIGLSLFVGLAAMCFTYMQLYRGMWHFASIEDLVAIIKAVTLSILLFAFLMFTVSRLNGFPRSALLINWLLLIFLLGGSRLAYRLYKDRGFQFAFKRDDPSIPIILYGGDHNAEIFVRDCLRNHQSLYRVIGIIDPDPTRTNRTLHGVKIYNASLPYVSKKLARQGLKAQRLVIAEQVDAATMQHLLEEADALGLTLSRLPRIDQLENTSAATLAHHALKPINIEDLLGRPQAQKDSKLMHEFIGGKCLLVTGAGGSIGSELCRQIAAAAPLALILAEQSEFALYTIHAQISRQFPGIRLIPTLLDVRDKIAVEHCIRTHKPEVIFHAAAIKHVPLSEQNPLAAIHTNVIGTQYMQLAAKKYGVASMVLISTDKAVHPTNIMGASKRLAERCFLEMATGTLNHVVVRFGNVLGSAGSVVPLFEQQLNRGGPLTVTHPDMTRYFMTIREAVDLVIHAAAMAHNTQQSKALYVLDMGEPINITTLARQMIRLSGLKPEKDIGITYTGLRPGEKLFEELFYPSENPQPTQIPAILQSTITLPSSPDLEMQISQLEQLCQQHETLAALQAVKSLVPEYTV